MILQFINRATIALPQRSWWFICVSSALTLRACDLNYAHDNCPCATADKGIRISRFHSSLFAQAQKFHNSILAFHSSCHPREKQKAKPTHSPEQETAFIQRGPQERVSQIMLPRFLSPKLRQTLPLQNTSRSPNETRTEEKQDELYEVIGSWLPSGS